MAQREPLALIAELLQRMNEQPSVQIAPSHDSIVAVFEGDSTKAAEWLKALQQAKSVQKWTDQLALSVALDKLRGPAKSWYLAKADTITDWTTFVEKFKRSFVSAESSIDLYERLRQRKQREPEDVMTYFFDNLQMCKKLNFDLELTKHHILTGLAHNSVSEALLPVKHADEDELLDDLRKFEQLHRARRSTKPPVARHQTPTTADGDKTRKGPRCYNCQQYGHIAKNCNSAIESDPKAKPKLAVASKKVENQVSTGKPSNGNYLVSSRAQEQTVSSCSDSCVVRFDDSCVKALIDTGASRSLIKHQLVERLGKPIYTAQNANIKLYGIGGEERALGVTTCEVEIDSCKFEDVELIVVNNSCISDYDALIGTDIIDRERNVLIRHAGQSRLLSGVEKVPQLSVGKFMGPTVL